MRGPINGGRDEEKSWRCHPLRQASPILHWTLWNELARLSRSPCFRHNLLTHSAWVSGWWCTGPCFLPRVPEEGALEVQGLWPFLSLRLPHVPPSLWPGPGVCGGGQFQFLLGAGWS